MSGTDLITTTRAFATAGLLLNALFLLAPAPARAAAPHPPAASRHPTATVEKAPAGKPSDKERARLAYNEGTRLAQAGKTSPAVAQYLSAVKLDPTLYQAYANLGVMYARLKQWGPSEDAFRKVAQLLPKDPRPLLQLASVQRDAGEPGASRDTLQRAVSLFPDSVPVRLSLSQSFESDKSLSPAEEQLKEATVRNSKSLQAWQALAQFYYRHPSGDAFEKTLERLWALDPKNSMLAFDLAVLAQKQKDWARAVTYYRAVVRLNPKNQPAWQNLGAIYSILKRPQPSADAYARAARLGPGDARLQLGLGLTYFNEKKYAAAETAFRKAVQLDPKSPEIQVDLAASLMRQQKLKEAEPIYLKLRAEGRSDPALFDSLAYIYGATGRQKDAIALYRKAIAAHPDEVGLHRSLGTLLVSANQPDAAIAEFKQVHRLAPKDASAIGYLGFLYQQNHRIPDAVALYQEAVKDQPSMYRQLAALHQSQGQADLQIADLEAWTKAEPKNADAWIALASAQETAKKPVGARKTLESGLAANPADASLSQAASAFFVRQGNSGEAEKIIRDALAKSPSDPSLHAALGALIAVSDTDGAIEEYRLAEAGTKDPRVAVGYGLKVADLMKKNGDVAVTDQYQRLMRIYPDDPNVKLQWASMLAERKQYADAFAQVKMILLKNPNAYPEGPQAIQDLLAWTKPADRLDEAVATLEPLAIQYPQNSQILYALSSLFVDQETQKKIAVSSNEPGMTFFRLLAARHPDSSGVQWAMADYAGRRGLIDAKIAILKERAAKEPANPAAPSALGTMYSTLEDWEQAVTWYREAVKRAPNTAYYSTALAKALESAGKPKDALAAYKDAQKIEPMNIETNAAIKRLENQ